MQKKNYIPPPSGSVIIDRKPVENTDNNDEEPDEETQPVE
jgi:hypothetical protein